MSTNPPAFTFPTKPTHLDRLLAGAYAVALTVLTSPSGGARLPDPEPPREAVRRGSCGEYAAQFGEEQR